VPGFEPEPVVDKILAAQLPEAYSRREQEQEEVMDVEIEVAQSEAGLATEKVEGK